MNNYVLSLRETSRANFILAGGKGANLGELLSIEGLQVPEGFCVTTRAYKKITENNQQFNSLVDGLAAIDAANSQVISAVCADIRSVIENIRVD